MGMRKFAPILLALVLGRLSSAQEFRGSVAGTVLDQQGAAVPGARVAARQTETGARSQTTSGTEGQFTLPFLAPGTYSLTVEADGFKSYLRDGLTVSTNDRLDLDIKLQIGASKETVTVTEEAPLLQTATASTGQVINSRQIENMPMNGRTPLVLAQLSFGVIPNSDPRFYRPFDDGGPSGFAISGAPNRQNEILLDGTPDASVGGGLGFSPPVDSVVEVKVEAFSADAAYGHSGGGTVNMVTKAGANAFHGSAYNFNQVSKLGATLFFTNLAGRTKSVTNYNQWGLTTGGPVLIPKLFNGRNRLFYFFAYEGISQKLPQATSTTVPTSEERAGDFSALLKLGANYQIYDPSTGTRQGTRIGRNPFAGNLIPAARISPIGRNILGYIDAPNQPGRTDGTNNFYIGVIGEFNTFSTEVGRIDFNVSDRHKLFYNFRHNDRLLKAGANYSNNATGTTLAQANWGTTLDDVYTLTPTVVFNVRLNWLRNYELRKSYSDGFDYTTLGLPKSLLPFSSHLAFPQINFDSFGGLGTSRGGGVFNPYDNFQILTTLSKTFSRHAVKAGADLRLLRHNTFNNGQSAGIYNFSSNYTRGPLDNSTAGPLGQDMASLLLGLPTGGSWDYNTAESSQNGYMAFFVQDDWRVKPNLTLNIGLRLEHELPTTERYNRSVNGFDFNTPNPVSAAAIAAYARNPLPELPVSAFKANGGLLFANSSNRNLLHTPAVNIGPRFGLAWTPPGMGGKTVIRAGMGAFFFPVVGVGTAVDQTGFSQSTQLVATLDSYLTPYSTLANPFPDGIQLPLGSSQGLATFLGRGVGYTSSNLKSGYSLRWNFDIQREITKNTVVELGYVGNHGVHMALNRPLGIVPAQFLSKSLARDQNTIDFLTANVTNPFSGLLPGTSLNGSTIQRQNLLQAFPQFSGLTERSTPQGSSYFEMIQARLERRFHGGFQVLANYLYSKLLERRSLLNSQDPLPEKRISSDDRPQRVVISLNWNLPFGKGRAIGSNAGPLAGRLIGGWTVNSISVYQPGGPLGWGNVIYFGGDLKMDPRNIYSSFDVTRFNRNSAQQLGSNLRAFSSQFANLRQDGANNVDFSVIKNTALKESLNLQFRCEFFNFMNHATFNAPNLTPTSSAFGTITSQANLARSTQLALRLVW